MTRLALLCLWLAVLVALLLKAETADEPPTKGADAQPPPLGRNQIEARFVIPLDSVEKIAV